MFEGAQKREKIHIRSGFPPLFKNSSRMLRCRCDYINAINKCYSRSIWLHETCSEVVSLPLLLRKVVSSLKRPTSFSVTGLRTLLSPHPPPFPTLCISRSALSSVCWNTGMAVVPVQSIVSIVNQWYSMRPFIRLAKRFFTPCEYTIFVTHSLPPPLFHTHTHSFFNQRSCYNPS